ncbi:MAG TPA: hypothetical protein VD993_06425 [Chitinophagaceae bacterium]|nr:hypothetical protein [Chitinophagaceae bacterium]
MKFLFHSVITEEGHATYYNIYRVDDSRYFAECHHFNRERNCDGDFELQKDGDEWKPSTPQHQDAAQQLGEEIERFTTV